MVTDTAKTFALHQKTYVTMMYGLIYQRLMMIKCEKTEDEDRIHIEETRTLIRLDLNCHKTGGGARTLHHYKMTSENCSAAKHIVFHVNFRRRS